MPHLSKTRPERPLRRKSQSLSMLLGSECKWGRVPVWLGHGNALPVTDVGWPWRLTKPSHILFYPDGRDTLHAPPL